jgi:hypothetical protein
VAREPIGLAGNASSLSAFYYQTLEALVINQRAYRYRAQFQNKTVVWTLALTPDGKISGIQPSDE